MTQSNLALVDAVRPVMTLRVRPGADADVPTLLLDALELPRESYEFFERWGYRKLALQMVMGEAKTLANDPLLRTSEARMAHDWVVAGDTGILPFNTCLAWMGLYDFEGQYLDDVVRREILARPEAFVRALKQCESVIDSSEQKHSNGNGASSEDVGASMTLSERIEHVLDEDVSIESDGDYPGAPVRMGFPLASDDYLDRPGRSVG